MKDPNCPFCNGEIEKQGIIYEDDQVVVFPTVMPVTPGHTLVCPKRHVQNIEELTDKEVRALHRAIVEARHALEDAFGVEGFNIAWNEGQMAGQSVNHLHIHVVPRKEGDEGIYEYNPREFLYRPGSREISPSDELQEITKLLKNSWE